MPYKQLNMQQALPSYATGGGSGGSCARRRLLGKPTNLPTHQHQHQALQVGSGNPSRVLARMLSVFVPYHHRF
jgi:hypothetical protein